MRLQKSEFLNIADTLISDVFITDYLLDLSKEAIATYLVLNHLYQKHNLEFKLEELSQTLGLEPSAVDTALDELLNCHLITIEQNDLWIADLKKDLITRRYRSVEDAAMRYRSQQSDAREQVIRQINDTFGQGLMSMSLLNAYDEIFARYDFEPEVVYALAREVHITRKVKNSSKFLLRVAQTWHEAGIKKYSQLEQYMCQRDKLRTITKSFRSELGMYDPLTRPQQELLKKWVITYNYDLDILKFAIQIASKSTNITFNYLDSIISKWYGQKLRTIAEIREFESEYTRRKPMQTQKNFRERALDASKEKEEHLQELLRMRQQQDEH